ncbi:hypothetical protein NP233_g1657 [Leucocoprinus birnbaumii]|uniref:Uncharacterized protein n=1 Tax=Leucocoprinus birnbaumii TaxID=56174 RepID=A0AAD5VZK2_9AGAR|nr:hypothetical protein NP233_g1657 [Leucocoprinus birnbaumii]
MCIDGEGPPTYCTTGSSIAAISSLVASQHPGTRTVTNFGSGEPGAWAVPPLQYMIPTLQTEVSSRSSLAQGETQSEAALQLSIYDAFDDPYPAAEYPARERTQHPPIKLAAVRNRLRLPVYHTSDDRGYTALFSTDKTWASFFQRIWKWLGAIVEMAVQVLANSHSMPSVTNQDHDGSSKSERP